MSTYNIKQITNYDIINLARETKTIKNIPVLNNGEIQYISKTIEYVTIPLNAIKIGYSCDPSGIIYPIFIITNNNNENKMIYPGKEGMYEIQPETWQNINDSTSEETTDTLIITQIQVPTIIDFIIDYVIQN